MPTFDLLEEPWIPVVRRDGSVAEANLRQVLRDAPALREIRDPIPTVEFGLYRLLVALVMDTHRLGDTEDLAELLAAGSFDASAMDAYFDRWVDRFGLFDSEHPFLQSPGMEGYREKPLAGMFPAVPSGTNVTHFHHYAEDSFGVCPAAAARLLTAMAPFMTAGGAGKSPSINGAPPWYVLISGDTLFETLCLNCCVVPLPQATGNTPPAWRNDEPPAEDRASHASLLEALTWRPRRIQLIPGGPGDCSVMGVHAPCLVRTMRFEPGASRDPNFAWRDPNVPYRMTETGATPLRSRENRELWRDTGAVALLQHKDYESDQGRRKVRFERPALVSQFAQMVADGILDSHAELALVAYGMRTDLKMKVFEWQREPLSLPAPLVWRSAFRAHAQRAMDQAESVAYYLKQAVKRVYPREGKGNPGAFDARVAAAQQRYWTTLRPDYDVLLRRLADLSAEVPEEMLLALRASWQERLRHVGLHTLDEAIGDLDTDADQLRRQIEARAAFRQGLRNLFMPPEVREARRRTTRGRASIA